jgi:hypothetical protein
MFLRALFVTALAATLLPTPARADGAPSSEDQAPTGAMSAHAHHAGGGADGAPRPDDHAPIGVMGEHMHPAGGAMLSYRYMRMRMDGNRDGTSRRSTADVLADPRFLVTPTYMDMEMHMFGAMWAPADAVTLTAMVPFVRKDMRHKTMMGRRFTTRTKGLGDVKASALVRLFDDEMHHLHLNAGISFPTGSISEKDDTPAGRQRLPYPMQLGTGTYDLIPGLTYTGRIDDWSWGGQALLTYRLGENRKDYKWGHEWETTGWVQRRWLPWLSTSLRLDYREWNDIRGRDDDLALIVPTAFPDLRGGERLDLLVGANFVVTGGPLRGHRFALELGTDLYQDLDGPQLESDWQLVAGWQLAF